MHSHIKIAFASGTDDLNRSLIVRMRALFPDLPLYVVSDFPPEDKSLKWIPYFVNRTFADNLARCRFEVAGKHIRLAGVMLVPNVPFRRMRLLALALSPRGFIAFNENLDNFMLRPRSAPAMVRHFLWRAANFLRVMPSMLRVSGRVRLNRRAMAKPAKPILNIDRLRFPELAQAFDRVPDLFCATAPLRKMPSGSDLNYVIQGNAAHSVYDAEKLSALGGAADARELSYRAWRRGWPTVEVAASKSIVAHAPTCAVGQSRLTGQALTQSQILALTSGDVAVFPGLRHQQNKPTILIATCYMIFPLSHGGAVRMYNLMRRAASDFNQVLISFTDDLYPPPPEALDICTEIVLVRREGSHALPETGRPAVVEEFASDAFSGALRQTIRKWKPAIAQLEFTQMAQYAADCAPARTILIEHDITFDLYQQMLAVNDDWELRRQLKLWKRFETGAWQKVDRIVTMSSRDRQLAGARALTLPNGVDLERFRPAFHEPEPRRILFIGSFAHLPNLLALRFFVNEVWPLLDQATLHIIAGMRHDYFLDYYRDRVEIDLARPGIEIEGFVSDVRPAYQLATVVIAPLVASAGTNIKVLEAMAMGRAVVSTSAGINGLDLAPGVDMLLANTAAEIAAAIGKLFTNPEERRRIERAARQTVERDFDWDAIARRQATLYAEEGILALRHPPLPHP